MAGIVSFGVHIPRMRLQRSSIIAAHGWSNPALAQLGKGERAICNWDEDPITMAVEAARRCLNGRTSGLATIQLASTTFPFADRQNSTVVAEALNLDRSIASLDVANSRRAGTTSLLAALSMAADGRDALVIAADRRLGKAASPQELLYGDGAAALLVGNASPLARCLGSHSEAIDFIDQYRGQRDAFDHDWEERWVRDEGYLKIVPRSVETLLHRLELAPGQISHFVMPCWLRGVSQQIAKRVGIPQEAVVETLIDCCGDTGVAHPLIMLVQALEKSSPGEKICVVGFGQGCDVLVLEATAAIRGRPAHGTSAALAERVAEVNYNKLAAFSGVQLKEYGKRAEVDRQTYLSAFYRNRRMLTAFVGGRCRSCGVVQFPMARYCVNPACESLDSQDESPLADVPGRVLTWTADHLAFDMHPPSYYGLVQFANGARLLMDFTEIGADGVKVGDAMRVQFRIKHFDEPRGFRRYFWKAVRAREAG